MMWKLIIKYIANKTIIVIRIPNYAIQLQTTYRLNNIDAQYRDNRTRPRDNETLFNIKNVNDVSYNFIVYSSIRMILTYLLTWLLT